MCPTLEILAGQRKVIGIRSLELTVKAPSGTEKKTLCIVIRYRGTDTTRTVNLLSGRLDGLIEKNYALIVLYVLNSNNKCNSLCHDASFKLIPRNTSFGVLKPSVFLGRLFNLSITV